MNKLKFILAASIAATLTLSCTDGGGDDGGGSSSSGGGDEPGGSSSGGNEPSGTTETYSLLDVDSDYFTYREVTKEEYCAYGGVLETENYPNENTVNYSIDNKILTWQNYWYDDTLQFKGTSNELIGPWTRTKDKNASCGLVDDYYEYCADGYWDDDYEDYICIEYDTESYSYYSCKEGYDITKAVFTDATVAITRNYCPTDYEIDGDDYGNGWRSRVVDCNTMEIYKGSDKITLKETRTSEETSYRGKSCKRSEPSEAQKKAACRKAWNEYEDVDSYWEILREQDYVYYECLDGLNLPPELLGEGDDYYGKVAAKPAAKAKAKAKAKFTTLLKKKK